MAATQKKSLRYRWQENASFLKEILSMIMINKKWWLIPIFMVLFFLSTFMVLLGGNSVLPAIYALF